MSATTSLNSESNEWLINLRAAAVLGITTVLGIVIFYFGMELPVLPILGAISVVQLSNIILRMCISHQISLGKYVIGGVLVFDTLMLALILYYSGGCTNPFSTLFLVQIALSVVVLGSSWTWLLACLSSTCYLMLFYFYEPVKMFEVHQHGADNLSLHLYGMLFSFMLTAGLIAYFLDKVSSERKAMFAQREDQLRLASLATLAAGSAHELGSPLSAIAVGSAEIDDILKAEPLDYGLLLRNASFVRDGVESCRKIIDNLGGRIASSHYNIAESFQVRDLLMDLDGELKEKGYGNFSIQLSEDIVLDKGAELLYAALREIIKNALQASTEGSTVIVKAYVLDGRVVFEVLNQGQFIPKETLRRVSEPFFTTKEPGEGMGLGLFIVELSARSLEGEFSLSSFENESRALFSIPINTRIKGKYAYG